MDVLGPAGRPDVFERWRRFRYANDDRNIPRDGVCHQHRAVHNGDYPADGDYGDGVFGGAPVDVVALAGDSDALVTFVPPSNASQLTGVKYTVTALPGGTTCVTSTTRCFVTGLKNGTAYTFSVVMNSTSPTAASSIALSNSVTTTGAPILNGPNGLGVTSGVTPIKPLSPGTICWNYSERRDFKRNTRNNEHERDRAK